MNTCWLHGDYIPIEEKDNKQVYQYIIRVIDYSSVIIENKQKL